MYYSKNLELHIVDHCNMDCVGCSHESPFLPRRFEDPERLRHALEALWLCYHAPLLKLLGGEPLLHPAINDIIEAARQTTNARIRLVTNGTLLERWYQRLHSIDEIHISSYSDARIPSDESLRVIAANLGASITVQPFGHFRWHRSAPRHDANLTRRIFATCQLYHSWQCHTLRDGWFYPCPPAGTWASANGEGVNLLDKDPDYEGKIEALLTRAIPFASCRECLGSVGQRFEHHTGWRRTADAPRIGESDSRFLQSLELTRDAHNGCFQYDRTIHPDGSIQPGGSP